MKTNLKTNLAILALGAGLGTVAQAAPAPDIYVNGQRLATAAVQQEGRVLVPLRDIFEQLGATVNYNALNRSIVAQKGSTTVRMALDTRRALVNNVPVTLDVAARAYNGRTLVPLRFVSEALGAQVNYNAAQRMVSIGGSGSQVGGFRQITVPTNVVVPVTLDQELSSATATRGQQFTASVSTQQPGDSEFPAGTRVEGVVTGVQRKEGNNPGVLELDFRAAILPGGQRVPLSGSLISLDNDSVTQTGGRLVARGERKNDALKVIGIGAGAGYLIGRLLDQNGLISALIGAAGGYLYDQSRDKNRAAEARLETGTRLGVRLDGPVTYRDTTGYYDLRSQSVRM